MDISGTIISVLSAGWAIYNITESIKAKSIQRGSWVWFLGTLAIVGIVYGVAKNASSQQIEDSAYDINNEIQNKIQGVINDGTPANIGSFTIGKNGPKMILLNELGIFSFDPPFKNLFRIYTEDNKLRSFISLKDREGAPLATIDGNAWSIFNNKDYEFNSDDSAFEIVTKGDRNVFFQIELRGGMAHISGFVYVHKNTGLCFYEGEANGGAMVPISSEHPFVGHDRIASRLFKYPISLYSKIQGVRL